MITSLSTTAAPLLPDTASVSVPVATEGSSTQLSQPSQSGTSPGSTSNTAATQDTVDLSPTALDMSKSLLQQADQRSEIKKEAAKQEAQPASTELKSYTAPGKSFPPFMGNTDELKKLKETSPSLYREILRMIVPPPVDLSYSDMQMLRSTKAGNSSISVSG